MPRSLLQIRRSILLQQTTACLIWLVLVVKLAACLWLEANFTLWWPWNAFKSMLSPTSWMYTIGFALVQAPVLIVHCALVSPSETQPLQLPRKFARIKRFATLLILKWTPTSWLRALQLNQSSTASQRPEGVISLWNSIPHIHFQHALGRIRGWKQIIKALLFVLALAISAIFSTPLYQSARSSHAGQPLLAVTSFIGSKLQHWTCQMCLHPAGGLNDAIFGVIVALTFVIAFFARYSSHQS